MKALEDTGYGRDQAVAERLVKAMIVQCPEGLERIEFEQWVDRNFEKLLPKAGDDKDSFYKVWQKNPFPENN